MKHFVLKDKEKEHITRSEMVQNYVADLDNDLIVAFFYNVFNVELIYDMLDEPDVFWEKGINK